MRYCPSCGAEYRPDFDECADCLVPLGDRPPPLVPDAAVGGPSVHDLPVVFRSGRRMDAELVRSRLEADGLEAWIWSSGLGPWRMESAVTEMTGVPSDFNAHHVVVNEADLDRAREVLDAEEVDLVDTGFNADEDMEESVPAWMDWLRDPRVVTALVLLFLFFVVLRLVQ